MLLVSLSGLPPLLGFWAKLLVFGTGLSAVVGGLAEAPQLSWALAIAVASGILGSVVSLGYYGSILRTLFFDSPQTALDSSREEPEPEAGGTAAFVVTVLALVVVALSIIPFLIGPSALFSYFAAG